MEILESSEMQKLQGCFSNNFRIRKKFHFQNSGHFKKVRLIMEWNAMLTGLTV